MRQRTGQTEIVLLCCPVHWRLIVITSDIYQRWIRRQQLLHSFHVALLSCN